MEGELTGLLLVFLVQLISICGANKVCDADIWSSNETLYAGGAYDVFCRCNHSDVRSEDLHLRSDGIDLDMEVVDNFTAKHTVNTAKEKYINMYYCYWKDTLVKEILFLVLPLLKVSNLKCRHQDDSSIVACGFSRIGDPRFWRSYKYSLSLDSRQPVGCRETPEKKTWMQCMDIELLYEDFYVKRHNLSLQLEAHGITQSQRFQINLDRITVPTWPTESPILETTEENICLEWNRNFWKYKARNIEWRIQLLLRNQKIDPQWPKIDTFPDDLRFCFDTPSFGNQIYDVKLWCRFINPFGPYTDDYYPFTFTTPATLPQLPPEIVPNGFFHDTKQKKLYVFWIQLTELQFNGPNFTYIAQTQTGKTASLLSNNTAVFDDWDATHSSLVYVWSQNSEGPSANKSNLEVPVLTHERSRQPQELDYHADNLTITWRSPEYQSDLVGYVVTWCSASPNTSQICDDLKPINYRVLEESQHHFNFNSSMVFSNVAVAARYKDNSGGGMQWNDPRFVWATKETSFRWRWSYYLGSALLLLTLFLLLISIDKLRRMSDIAVSVPDGLFIVNWKSNNVAQLSNPPAETAVPGSVAPKTIVDVNELTGGTFLEPIRKKEPCSYVDSYTMHQFKTSAYTSYSKHT